MSSSKEILLFRQILLNPVTCQQFQDFVYSKGGFLENDVLFWLEVQRYKVRHRQVQLPVGHMVHAPANAHVKICIDRRCKPAVQSVFIAV